MYFSEQFEIHGSESMDWFDPLLETDTRVFVDPFLIFKESSGSWADSHQEIATYFQNAFELLAPHYTNPSSLQYKRVLTLMQFPEPVEFGLGFVGKGTGGSGTGKGFARRIVESMCTAIERGLQDLRHFEELGVLVDKIHRDRISDITCNILKPRFIAYTQRVAEELSLPTAAVVIPRSYFDPHRKRWLDYEFNCPINPVSGRAVLLTPKRFIAELPKLNSDDWFKYAEPQLRDDFNLALLDNLRKEDIISLARRNPELVREWTTAREGDPAEPYNIDRDPAGLYNWQRRTRGAARRFPLEVENLHSQEDLQSFIRQIIGKFKHMIEEQGMWRLLYNDDTGKIKREEAIQLAFKGIVQSYCEAYGVRLEREVELGRGPVDFILSTDSRTRVLLEIKKMSNGEYWNGLERQLTSYLNSDGCNWGWFLAVRSNDRPSQRERTEDLQRRCHLAASKTGFNLNSEWVDARPKESASNLKPGSDGTTVVLDDDDEYPDTQT